MQNVLFIFFLPLWIFLSSSSAYAAGFQAKVIHIIDGDTITVLRSKTQVRVRLYGVDTPEKAQAFGQKAKRFTARLVAGKQVKVKVVTNDRSIYTFADVTDAPTFTTTTVTSS